MSTRFILLIAVCKVILCTATLICTYAASVESIKGSKSEARAADRGNKCVAGALIRGENVVLDELS